MLNKRETATVLAALRLWQWVVENNGLDHELRQLNPERMRDLDRIAGEGGGMMQMHQIDALCERLNCGPEEPAAALRALQIQEDYDRVKFARQAMLNPAIRSDGMAYAEHDRNLRAVADRYPGQLDRYIDDPDATMETLGLMAYEARRKVLGLDVGDF